uniref:SRP54 domain-containing protein n=1 Tax=Globodera pallida TaxID=36090 RepID=A0A183BRC8_GLOPA
MNSRCDIFCVFTRIQTVQEVREALAKKLPRRRPEFIDMDRKLVHFVNTALLGTDQQIIVFLDAIAIGTATN